MRKIRALVCDFLTVSDILDIYAMHRSCESTFDFLTASDFLGKQFLNPTQKQKIYLHGDPFLVKACFVDRFLGECFLVKTCFVDRFLDFFLVKGLFCKPFFLRCLLDFRNKTGMGVCVKKIASARHEGLYGDEVR